MPASLRRMLRGACLALGGFLLPMGLLLAAVGMVISSFPSPSSGPFGLAWDGTNLWNADDNTGLIFEVTTTGTVLSSFAAPCMFTKGVTFDGTNLWATCDGTNLIYEMTTTGTILSTIPTPGPTARGLTWDGTNLWISDSNTDTVYEVTTTGIVLSSFPAPAPNARGLTWDGTNLWYADGATDTIYEVTTTGVVLSSFATPANSPRGLTFDGTNFWLSDNNTDLIYELEGPPPPPPPKLVVQKTSVTVDDPVNVAANPKAIPGANALYTIRVTNGGPGAVDKHTVFISDTLPPELELFVNDLGGPGSGPVSFVDGAPPSGLIYTFGGLGDIFDDLMFDDGSLTFTYMPVPNVDGYDANVTAIRINPKGGINGNGAGGGDPFFEVSFQARVR